MPTTTPLNLRNAVVKIKDGGSNLITVKMGEGNLTYDVSRNLQYLLDRGNLDSVIEGDEVPVDLKLDGRWDFITGDSSSGAITFEDALTQSGGAADWVSTDDDTCAPYAVDIVIEYTPSCEAITPETITFSDYRYEKISHDAKASTISTSGKCNITKPTAVRGAISS